MLNRLIRETVSTATLLIAIIGSAFLGSALTDSVGLVVLINGISTVAALYLLINLGGADLNPVVSLMKLWDKVITFKDFLGLLCAQAIGAVLGAVVANRMYSSHYLGISSTDRNGAGFLLGEFVATIGLLYIVKFRGSEAGKLVPAWILTAFFATSSTAFANPAVTFGRIFTESFSGISPQSAMAFIGMQLTSLIILQLLHSRKA